MPAHANLSAEITGANQRFMELFSRGETAAIAACYTRDAQLLVPHNEIIRGRDAIEKIFGMSAGHGHKLAFTTLELEGDEDSALEIGQYTRKDAGGAMLDRGKYLVVWKRIGSDWKIHRDMISTSLPKPA